ncbi:snoRNA-binding rRNA-processing protein utp10 [Basidiobolus ranarum]|uniref:U3 small nucleolar RNA-associated protein 10 n=1 Tax=Basidiobolus ranarum TaxID=34480 RepID=A0ABR2VV02_9FUNG
MASSLALQLQGIRTVDNPLGNDKFTSKFKASFLFDSRQAADYDLDTIFSLGINGLAELKQLNSHFAQFEKTLFSESIKSVDRVLQTKEDNEKLDASILAFLQQLSPYFLLKPAGKVLEWLIRRFRINEFNIDAVMTCILPYHETKPFVTMVSVLRIPDDSQWAFLRPIRKTAQPLERSQLVAQCIKEKYLLDFVCDITLNSANKKIAFKSLVSFYASTLIEIIQTLPTISDAFMLNIMPYVFDGIRAKSSPEFQLASYMLVSQLSTRAVFSAETCDGILSAMTQHFTDARSLLLCAIQLFQTQEELVEMPEKAFKHIAKIPELNDLLADICSKYASNKFLYPFLLSLIQHSGQHENYDNVLKSVLQQEKLPSTMVQSLCESILDLFLESKLASKDASDVCEKMRELLQLLQIKYSADIDASLESKLKATSQDKSASGKKVQQLLYEFISQTFKGTRHEPIQESNTTLYLSLNHPETSIRLIALQKLQSLVEDGSTASEFEDILEETLLARLADNVDQIAAFVIAFPNLAQHVSGVKLLSEIEKLLDSDDISRKTKIASFDFLIGSFLKVNPSLENLVTPIVLSNCVATKKTWKSTLHLLKTIPKSQLASSPLFANFSTFKPKTLDEIEMCEDKEKKLLGLVDLDIQLIKLIADNLVKDVDSHKLFIGAFSSSNSMWELFATLVLNRAIYLLDEEKCINIISTILPHILEQLNELRNTQQLSAKDFIASSEGLPSEAHINDIARKGTKFNKIHNVLFSLVNIVSCLKVKDMSSIPWLAPADNVSTTVKQYKDILVKLYVTFTSGQSIGCFEKMVRGLFEHHLQDDPIEFLSSFWTDDETECFALVQMRSLHIANAYFLAHADPATPVYTDFQLVIPSLLSTLLHPSKVVRHAGLSCLASIDKAYEKLMGSMTNMKTIKAENIYKYDSFYGSSSDELQYLLIENIFDFLRVIQDSKEEFLADPQYIERFLGEYLSKNSKDSKKQTTAKESILAFLLSHVISFRKPIAQIKLLRVLAQVNSSNKVKMLIPLMERLLQEIVAVGEDIKHDDHILQLMQLCIRCFTPATASLLDSKSSKYLKMFVSLLNTSTGDEDVISVQEMALAQITPELFGNLSATKRYEIFSHLISLASEASTTVVKHVKEVLKSISFDASLVSQEFAHLHQELIQEKDNQPKRVRESVSGKQPILVPLYNLITTLELLEYKSSIDKEITLISPLFEMLSVVLNLELGDTPVSVDYINQLILSSLTRLIRSADEKHINVEENILRVDLVVQCIRVTANPQTHNQSLLLMAAIASLYPDRVLHNIMPVFTFMGANVLRQDDNYSFHVIQQTLEKILPPLVASHRQASESSQKLILEVKPIMSVFVDALFHIPKHRRLRLFTVLVSTLGENEFLYAILSLLLEKYTEKVLKGNSVEADSLMEFCLIVSNQFSPQTQMNSLGSLMKALLVLPNEKSTEEEDVEDTLFDIKQHSNKHLRQFKFASLSFASKLLGNKAFLSKILIMQDDNSLEQYFLSISELLLSIVSNISTFIGRQTTRNDSIEKFWKSLLKVTYDVLDKVNNLLPLSSFLSIVSQLLNHEHGTIRRKSMLLLSEKVASFSECTSEEEAAFVEMVPRLAAVVDTASQQTEQDSVIKQTALLTVSALLRRFARNNPTPFADMLPIVIGNNGLGHSNVQVSASSLVCLTYFCQELGPRVIPQFPKFMPIILNILESCFGDKELSANTRLLVQLSAFSSLETIVKTLPQFLSPYVQRMLACALQPSLNTLEEDDKERKVLEKAQSVLSEMATKIPARILLPQVYQYLESAIKNGKNSLLPLYSVLETAISTMDRANISTYYKSIFKFFLVSFDFRRQHGSKFTAEEVDQIESKIINSFLQLVMKLNETLFKPLFLKTLDWATTELPTQKKSDQSDSYSRLVFFYKLLDTLLDKLKSIISPYYVYVLDHTIAKLEEYKDEDKAKATDSLWVYMVDSLHKCFLYDNDNFWSGEVFNKILQPLVDQMESTSGGVALYHEHIDQHLVPCLGQLAVTASNEALWKPLNHQVLLKSRSDKTEVRLASLLTLQDFYSRLGEEFLVLLPETIPFLAELMEDDEQKVEKLTQEVIAQIEQYLGESLQKYFH